MQSEKQKVNWQDKAYKAVFNLMKVVVSKGRSSRAFQLRLNQLIRVLNEANANNRSAVEEVSKEIQGSNVQNCTYDFWGPDDSVCRR